MIRCANCGTAVRGIAGDPYVAVEGPFQGQGNQPEIICQNCAGERRDAGIPREEARTAGRYRQWIPWPEDEEESTP